MKNRLILIFAILFLSNLAFANEQLEKGRRPYLNDLIVLEKNNVKTYQGYKFDVTWLNGLPMINIDFVQIDASTHKLMGFKSIALVVPEKSTWEQLKVKMELMALKSFNSNNININVSGPERIQYYNDDLYQFDVYDSNKTLGYSEWRDVNNGFPIKNVIYKSNGIPLNMVFYYNLEINKPFNPINKSSKMLVGNLNKTAQRFGGCQFDSIDDVIRFCIGLVNQTQN